MLTHELILQHRLNDTALKPFVSSAKERVEVGWERGWKGPGLIPRVGGGGGPRSSSPPGLPPRVTGGGGGRSSSPDDRGGGRVFFPG